MYKILQGYASEESKLMKMNENDVNEIDLFCYSFGLLKFADRSPIYFQTCLYYDTCWTHAKILCMLGQ